MSNIVQFPARSKFEEMQVSRVTGQTYDKKNHVIVTHTDSGTYKFKLDPWQRVEKLEDGSLLIY